MKNLAIVPVKGLADGKKRLATYLGPSERKSFVEAMLLDVLDSLHKSRQFAEIMVISPDPSVSHQAHESDSLFLRQHGTGLNSAVRQATHSVLNREVSSITTVLADLPLLEARDVEELVQISGKVPRVVLAPSLKGGTNVMLRAPPSIVHSHYGRWSYAKHMRSAQTKGVSTYSISNSRISFDIDTVDDLRKLRQLESSEKTRSGMLARDLRRLHPLARHS